MVKESERGENTTNLQRLRRFVGDGVVLSGNSGHGGGNGRWELWGQRKRGCDNAVEVI